MKVETTSKIPEVMKQFEAAMARALTRAAIDVDRTAKEKCPVDTGRLRASISYTVNESEGYATVGTNVVYPRAIEYGHSKKAPSGYLRAALDEHQEDIKKIIVQEFKDVGK